MLSPALLELDPVANVGTNKLFAAHATTAPPCIGIGNREPLATAMPENRAQPVGCTILSRWMSGSHRPRLSELKLR